MDGISPIPPSSAALPATAQAQQAAFDASAAARPGTSGSDSSSSSSGRTTPTSTAPFNTGRILSHHPGNRLRRQQPPGSGSTTDPMVVELENPQTRLMKNQMNFQVYSTIGQAAMQSESAAEQVVNSADPGLVGTLKNNL
jgi:hypothetical protein